MAVVRVRNVDEGYACLSSDVKPTKGIGVGTIITEIDTGAKFIWYNGVWEEDLTMIYAVKKAME